MVRFLLKVLVLELVIILGAVTWVVYDGMKDSPGPADCAVVFGEAPTSAAEPDPVLQAQLDRAIELYREKIVPQVIISSADATQGGDGAKVLSSMTQYLLTHGLPASRLLSDSKGTSLDASAGDVASYLQQAGLQNVMIVVPYYEIMRTKLALWRAGVGQVTQAHVGRLQAPDAVPAAEAIGDAGVRVFNDDLKPAALKLIARAQGEGQELSDKIKSSAAAAPPAPASVGNTATAPASAATETPAAASSSAVPAAAPLADAQEVTATGIATVDIPRDWSERIVFPILDPLWAAPGPNGDYPANMLIFRGDSTGSPSLLGDDIARVLQAHGYGSATAGQGDPFTTAAGQQGYRMTLTVTVRNQNVQAVVYAFPARGNKLIGICCSCLAADASSYVPVFDASGKSIRPW